MKEKSPNTRPSLKTAIQRDLFRVMLMKFPSYYQTFPQIFLDEVILDVYQTSAWQDEGFYSDVDISLAIQRVALKRMGVTV